MMAKKKQKQKQKISFFDTAYGTIIAQSKREYMSHQAAVIASGFSVVGLAVLAVVEQLRIANLIALSEVGSTRAGDAAWQEINGGTAPDEGGGLAPWVAQALGIKTEEAGGE